MFSDFLQHNNLRHLKSDFTKQCINIITAVIDSYYVDKKYKHVGNLSKNDKKCSTIFETVYGIDLNISPKRFLTLSSFMPILIAIQTTILKLTNIYKNKMVARRENKSFRTNIERRCLLVLK